MKTIQSFTKQLHRMPDSIYTSVSRRHMRSIKFLSQALTTTKQSYIPMDDRPTTPQPHNRYR